MWFSLLHRPPLAHLKRLAAEIASAWRFNARGALIMDAHLAALAIEHGATLCTNDRDFLRFAGLKVEFPLQ
jgi:predicted nucleic acid-binding protein